MHFEVTRGVQYGTGVKAVIYGQEGVGKTTLAAQIPGAVFIDCEGSTTKMDVNRLPKPTSWQMLCQEMDFVLEAHKENGWQAVIIDTFDWAERLALEQICAEHKVSGIEGMNYGKGWQYEAEAVGRFLENTDRLIQAGIHVILLCHAISRKTTLPEELDEFDHWELKLGSKTTNKIAPLLKEWSDMTLFLAFRTQVIAVDDKGKKHKATNVERVMYTTKSAWWDAKNRFGLPDMLPLDYAAIAHLFAPAAPVQQLMERAEQMQIPTELLADSAPADTLPQQRDFPGALADLMEANKITAQQIETVSSRVWGYFPEGMPLASYPQDYCEYLVANWNGVVDAVKANCSDYVPF